MATPALIVTPGAVDANSYASLVEATAYFDTQLYRSNWEGATDDERNRALLSATRILDEQMNWKGLKYTEEQALRWPRSSVVGPDGYDVSYLTIPQFLINATAELSEHLIESNRTAEPDTLGYSRMKVGELELVIDKYDRAPTLPDSVWQMIRPYGSKVSGQQVKVYRT